jgi:hypothetical protein
MQNLRSSLLVFLPAALLLVAAGCGSDETAAPSATLVGDDFATLDFDAPFGGLTLADELPGFGDRDLVAGDADIEGVAYHDDLADDPEIRAWLESGNGPGDVNDPERPQFTFVRIVWGKLGNEESSPPADGQDDGDEVDWSGEISVDRGFLIVQRVIDFERGSDYLVRPRPDRQTIAWASFTADDNDGLFIRIIEPPLNNGGGDGQDEPQPNFLHFRSGPFTQSFDVCDLAAIDELFAADVPGQAIQFHGFTLDATHPCPRGFMIGRWLGQPHQDPIGGTFQGRWVGVQGPVIGYMRGAYGVNGNGEQVFFGKYIGRNGHCLGLLAGTWETGPRPNYGWFQGRWFSGDNDVLGHLGGQFMMHPQRPAGTFNGRWSAFCGD